MTVEPSPILLRGRSRAIVLTTVTAWNVLALALVWSSGLLYGRSPGSHDGEDWSGLVAAIFVVVLTVAILVSMVVGLTVAGARTRRLSWPGRPLSTGGAVAAGSRYAAWGLIPIAVIPMGFVLASSLGAFS